MYGFLSGLERNNLDCVWLSAVMQRINDGNFRISAVCPLVIGGLIAGEISHDSVVNVNVIVRLSRAGVGPGHRELETRVRVGRDITGWQRHDQCVAIAREGVIVATRPGVELSQAHW